MMRASRRSLMSVSCRIPCLPRLVSGDPGHFVTDVPQLGEFRGRHRIERRCVERGDPIIPV
jgi:hypothetical protein